MSGLETVRLSRLEPDRRRWLLDSYTREVYVPAFPDAEIREDTAYWLKLLEAEPRPAPPQPLIEVILALDGDLVLGGATIELYRAGHAGFLTYIAVREDERGRGIGRRLVNEARRWLDEAGGEATPMLAETERFRDASGDREREETATRQRQLSSLGARRVDFDYVMPPLRQGLPPRRLHLLAIGEPPAEGKPLPAATAAGLIGELAAALGADLSAHSETAAMMAALRERTDIPLRPLPDRRFVEVPTFPNLDSTSFSFAFELTRTESTEQDRERRALRLGAIHDDMARRHKRNYQALLKPVRSFLDDVTTGPAGVNGRPLFFTASGAPETSEDRVVTLIRPPDWTYEYEDEVTCLTVRGPRETRFRLADSFCAFQSGRLFYILTLTQAPRPDSSERGPKPDPLDEYGVLQLQQLAIHPEVLGDDAGYLGFRLGKGGEVLSLAGLARTRLLALEEGGVDEISGVGSVVRRYQLLGTKASNEVDLARLRGLCIGIESEELHCCSERALQLERHWRGEECGPPEDSAIDRNWSKTALPARAPIGPHCQEGNSFSRSLLVYAGLAQGVPDFPYQDESEVHDSTKATARSVESALHVHPRFMLEIAKEWRSFASGRPHIGTCPYLLLKWMVAVHDELIVTDLERRLDETVYGEPVALGRAIPLDDVRKAMQGSVSHTRMVERNLKRRLELFRWTSIHRSGNLFRYPRERESLQAIQQAMGTQSRFDNAHDLVDRLESLVEDVTTLKSSYAERRTNRILFVIALFGIFSVAHDFQSAVGDGKGVGFYFILSAATAIAIMAAILAAGPISAWLGRRDD